MIGLKELGLTSRWLKILTIVSIGHLLIHYLYHKLAKATIKCVHCDIDLPHNQVCPPGLHITLGIFLRLFVLLEDCCNELDLSVELQGSEAGCSYERYATALRQQRASKDEAHKIEYNIKVLEQVATYMLATTPAIASLPVYQQMSDELFNKREQLQRLVSKHILF